MELPEEVVVWASTGSGPLANAWVRLVFGTDRKNDLSLLIGPTDGDGRAVSTRSNLLRQVQEIVDLFPMDYGGADDWDGSLRASVLNREGVRRVLEAFKAWGKAVGFESQADIDRLSRFGDHLEEIAGQDLIVAVEISPPDSGSVTELVAHA